jgi:hypothetical protein
MMIPSGVNASPEGIPEREEAPLAWVADVDVSQVVGRDAVSIASSRVLPEHVQCAPAPDADDGEVRGTPAGRVQV